MSKVNGRLQFGNFLTHQCTKKSQRKNLCVLIKKPTKPSEFYYLEPGLHPFFTDTVETMNTLMQKDTITVKAVS